MTKIFFALHKQYFTYARPKWKTMKIPMAREPYRRVVIPEVEKKQKEIWRILKVSRKWEETR